MKRVALCFLAVMLLTCGCAQTQEDPFRIDTVVYIPVDPTDAPTEATTESATEEPTRKRSRRRPLPTKGAALEKPVPVEKPPPARRRQRRQNLL